tara:strand:- start:1078 stop:1293 length:216 start_codon:yes stop_codon:yes gene_type:complete
VKNKDIINSPKHYTKGKIEVWDFIIDQQMDFLSANVIKYICRHKLKGKPLEDLSKARAYLDKLITEQSKNE